jgi:hypothetical protein
MKVLGLYYITRRSMKTRKLKDNNNSNIHIKFFKIIYNETFEDMMKLLKILNILVTHKKFL